MSPKLIDVHTHMFPPSVLPALERRSRFPRITEAGGRKMVEYGPKAAYPLGPAMTDPETKLAEMDENGIPFALISVNIPGVDWFAKEEAPSIARAANDELATIVAAHPDRCAALATLPLQVPEAAAEELRRAVGIGLKGALIYSNVAGGHLDDPALGIVYEAAAELDVPLSIHPAYPLCAPTLDAYGLIPVVGFLFDTSTAALRLIFSGLYDRHPDLKLVLGHAGSTLPYLSGRIDYQSKTAVGTGGRGPLEREPSEYIKLLYTDTICLAPGSLRLAIDYFGVERMMFGSDLPFWQAKPTFETLDALNLTERELALVNAGNAARLFRLDTI